MGCTSRVWMWFARERHARWAMHVAEDMLKILYAPSELPWAEEAENCLPLSRRYLTYRQEAQAYELDPRGTALEWLRRYRTMVMIERCQDISRWTGIDCDDELIPQLWFAYALRFPQVPFTALYRHEITVSGALQIIRAQYDGAVMRFQKKVGEWPMDEDDWSGGPFYDYAVKDGVFQAMDSG